MVRTIIFDWDGTLHNTKRLYGCAFRSAYQWLVEEGYAKEKAYSDDEVSIYLGMNAPDMWKAFMPQLPETVWRQASAIIGREMTDAVLAGKALLYDGVPQLLTQLKESGGRMIFLSNCKHAYMEAHRKVFHLDDWFDGFYCCEDYGFAPKEEIFPEIAAGYEGPYLMIGDRASDKKVAKTHGFAFIGCAYGFGTREELDGADGIAESVEDIFQIYKHFTLP